MKTYTTSIAANETVRLDVSDDGTVRATWKRGRDVWPEAAPTLAHLATHYDAARSQMRPLARIDAARFDAIARLISEARRASKGVN